MELSTGKKAEMQKGKKAIMLTNIENIEINAEFKSALDLIETSNESVFVTGKAGTGKSTLLSYLRATTKKNVVVLAPTGLAAINVGGQTIHSFFGLPPKTITHEDIQPSRKADVFKKLETIHKSKHEVVINWYYEEDDEDMLEAGEDYESIIRVPFKMIEIVD
jgi:ABC-type molybdenum transport system ATPase subunit/photorepair protein PhrA